MHTSKHTHRTCLSLGMWVLNKVLFHVLLLLNCQNTQVYVQNTCYRNETVGFVCEGKQLGKKSHVYIISVRVRTVMKNLEKSWNFKTAFSRPGKVLEKWINPESFGKVMEIYFTNLCIIQLCLFGSWISVRDCAWAISHISTLSRSFRL